MEVRSTMYYGDTPIADCTWTLDDRARTTQQALAALSVEDHQRAELRIEHKIVSEDDDDKKKESENESVNDAESETTNAPMAESATASGTLNSVS